MTDRTSDKTSTDGGVEVGSSAEDLFGGIEDDAVDGEIDRQDEGTDSAADPDAVDGHDADDGDDGDDDIEDQTAASVFGKLKTDVDDDDADELLEDESPEEIIESADEPAPNPDPIDEDLRADEAELADLLLTGRTKGEEFLWIDPDDDDPTASTDESDDPTAETNDSEPAMAANVSAASSKRIADNDRAPDLPTPGSDSGDDAGADDSATETDDESVSSDVTPDLEALESSPDAGSAALEAVTSDEESTDETTESDTDETSHGFFRRLLGRLSPF